MCARGHKMDMQHAMSCKMEGFITVRHNNGRDLTGNLLNIMCKDVEIKPKLLPITREFFNYQTAKTSNKAKVDFLARGILERG